MKDPKGEVYTGTLFEGKKHGKGKLLWPNGYYYDGFWSKDNFVEGNAKMKIHSIGEYTGEIKEYRRNGYGE